MTTANEDYLDAALRHQIGVRRYSSGLTKRIAKLLESADADLVKMLRDRLNRLEGKPIDFTSQRWIALIRDIREARDSVLNEYRKISRKELSAFAALEAAKESSILLSSIPIEMSFAAVSADQLRAIVSSRPFQGRLLREWFKTLQAREASALKQALQLGMAEGQTTDQIVRAVAGTRSKRYTDGVLAITRRDAQAVVRTAVNHVSNTARSYVWEANSSIVSARIWTSTLDGRTSAICQARDGKGTTIAGQPLPEGVLPLIPRNARPPAHINCRSTMVAFIDGIGLVGTRPAVVDIRNRRRREIDFRAQARREGRSIKNIRKEWADKNIGSVPSKTNYQDFLFRQSKEFQIEVLGPSRTKLFREGKVRLDQFVDRAGNELTLEQLKKTQPEAFKKIAV